MTLTVSVGSLSAAPSALADPAPAVAVHEPCPAATADQAHWLGDALFEQGAYQRAGACYLAAGDSALANQAFLKAVAPASAATARQLSDQRDQAKALLRQVQQAFR